MGLQGSEAGGAAAVSAAAACASSSNQLAAWQQVLVADHGAPAGELPRQQDGQHHGEGGGLHAADGPPILPTTP